MNAIAATVPRETSIPLVVEEVDVDLVDVGPNVRVNVAELEELAASIKEHGVLQPIKVRPDGDRWTVVWGQRRLLAARQVGLETIPAILDTGDKPPATLAVEQLVENLHRADLPPLDRARAMRAVVDSGVSQADLARELGLHPSTIANDLGLLDAPAPIQSFIADGSLSPSHAKALKGLAPKTQKELARDAVERGYSAHRLEEVVQRNKEVAEAAAKREREATEQTKKDIEQLRSAIAELATKKKPGLDTEIVVFQDYYGQGDVKIRELKGALEHAGFTKVRMAKSGGEVQARPKGCDCTLWKATLKSSYSYQSGGYTTKLQVTPACVDQKHSQAKAAADRKAENDKSAMQDRVREHVKATTSGWAIPDARAVAFDRILAEVALWGILSYRLPEWSEKHGGTRNKPWAAIHALTDEQLAKELAWELARDFRDKAGYHVDWMALAAELGIDEAEPPKTKAKA